MTLDAVTIDRALQDPELLGAALGPAETFEVWISVLKAAFGIELNREERRAFRAVAGSRSAPRERVREFWAVVGRRGGKSRMAAALAVFLAVLIDHTGKLTAGEVGYVLVLAPTQKQARLVFSYALGFLKASPVLADLVIDSTADEIRLAGGIVIATHPASFRSVRGRTLLACVFDEASFWRDETSATPDTETYIAVLPALASTGGMLIGISSAYRRIGLMFTKFRDHFDRDDDQVLVVRGSTEQFNPTIDRKVIEASRAADPAAAASEWDSEFRSDVLALLDDSTIDAAVDHDRPMELSPQPDLDYVCFVDASSGRHDAFSICVGHRVANKRDGSYDDARFVADVVRGRRPPFDPRSVAHEYAELARSYRCAKIVGDAYAGEWVASAFREAGIEYHRSDLPRSGLYLESLALWMRGGVSIPNHPSLIRELRLLERRVHRSGRDSVDHPQGGSDDHANCLAGAMRLSGIGRRRAETRVYSTGYDGVGPLRPMSAPGEQRSTSMMFIGRDYILDRDRRPPRRPVSGRHH